MVNAKLHIICGNCGQDLKEPGMATLEYIPRELDPETGEVINPATVYIHCENCATLHNIGDSIKEERPAEPLKNIDKIKAMEADECHEQNLALFKQLQAKQQKVKELEEKNEKLKIQLMQKDEVNMFFNTPMEGWNNDPCEICRYKQALEEIKKMLEIAEKTNNGDKHFEYMYNAFKKVNEVLND